MKIYYKLSAKETPTFFSPEDSPSERPDELSFLSHVNTNESPKLYTIAWNGDTPQLVRNANADAVIAQGQKDANAQAAQSAQNSALRELELSKLRKANKLPPTMSDDDEVALDSYIQLLQGDADNPDSGVYAPPLAPGVTPPDYKSFTVTVVREPGWQENMGFKVTLNSGHEDFVPASLSLGVYDNPDCQDYEYTTGAFTDEGDGTWSATCPAGHEPGDGAINFGILYSGQPVQCWTMPQGQTEQTITAFEEI